MAAPFPGTVWTVNDSAGNPVSGAKIYTYEAGTLTAKAVYTTSALTTAASNPVICDASGRAQFFMGGGSYRFRVFDSSDVELTAYAADNISGDVTAILAESSGASLVGFMPSGTGAVTSTVQTKLRELVSVKDFGAVVDGTTGGTAATNIAGIQAAIATGAKEIRFPGGTYSLGTLSASSALFTVTGVGVTFVADGPVEFTFAFADNGTQPILFDFTTCDLVRFVGTWKFTDSVGYNGSTIKGVKVFKMNDTCTNFTWEDVHLSGVLSGIEARGTADSRSIKTMRGKIKATGVYYVTNFIQNGDDVVLDIHATNCRREYFNYGGRGHKVRITMVDKNTGGTSLIESYGVYTNPTDDIEVDISAYFSGAPTIPILYVQHAPSTSSGTTPGINNVRVRYNVVAGSASANTSLGAIHLRAVVNGGSDITSGCNCLTDQIELTGSTNGAYVYDLYSEYTLTSGNTKGRAFWPYNAKPNANAVKILTPAKSFAWTPAISGSGWAIGDGFTEGNYTILDEGQALLVWGKITFGSTSTYGAAALSVDLPAMAYRWAGEGGWASGHPSDLTMVGTADLFDTSASTHYAIPVKTGSTTGANLIVFHGTGSTGYLVNTAPFTWATGDTIQFVAHLVRNNMGALAP